MYTLGWAPLSKNSHHQDCVITWKGGQPPVPTKVVVSSVPSELPKIIRKSLKVNKVGERNLLHSWKLTIHWQMSMFNRKYIFIHGGFSIVILVFGGVLPFSPHHPTILKQKRSNSQWLCCRKLWKKSTDQQKITSLIIQATSWLLKPRSESSWS